MHAVPDKFQLMHVPIFQELKELSENRQEHSDELTELQEAVEMATLDKEMAEERVFGSI